MFPDVSQENFLVPALRFGMRITTTVVISVMRAVWFMQLFGSVRTFKFMALT